MAGKGRAGKKNLYLRGLELPEGRGALSWALELWRPQSLSQLPRQPPPSPPARRPSPLAPALQLAVADWLVGVTCKGEGVGAPRPQHLCWATGCSAVQKNSPSRQSPGAGISAEKATVLPPGREASPTALTEVEWFALSPRTSFMNQSPLCLALPPHPPPDGPGLAAALGAVGEGQGR